MAINVDLEGRGAVAKWQMAVILLLLLTMIGMAGADVLGFVPRTQTVPLQAVNRLEREVQEIRSDQNDLRDEHEKLRIEMRRSFAEIKAILEEK